MADADMIRPFVHQVVAQTLGIPVGELSVDPDGRVPVTTGSVRFYVAVIDGPGGPVLQVYSPVVTQVKRNAKLLNRLNDENGEIFFCRLFWRDDAVFCAVEIPADDLSASQIVTAMDAVSSISDRWDDVLVGDFGGEISVPPDPADAAGEAVPGDPGEEEASPGYM